MKKILILTMIIIYSIYFVSCDNTPNTTQMDKTTEISTTNDITTENLTNFEKIRNYILDNGGYRVGIMGVSEKGYQITTNNNTGYEFEYDIYPSGQVYLKLKKKFFEEAVSSVKVYLSFVVSGTDTEEVKLKLEIYPYGRGMYDATDDSVMIRSNMFDTIDISYDPFPSTDTISLEPLNVYAEVLWNEYLRINHEALN